MMMMSASINNNDTPPSSSSSSTFSKIANFRDVSTSLTSSSSSPPLMKSSLFYRSANPDLATPQDQILLQKTYKIKTIIDLRTDSERVPRGEKKKSSSSSSSSNSGSSSCNPSKEEEEEEEEEEDANDNNIPADIPILNSTPSEPTPPFLSSSETSSPSSSSTRTPHQTLKINLNGPKYTSHLLSQLTYYNKLRLALLYTLNYRTQAIRILGENVIAARGLSGLAKDSLKYSRGEIFQIFKLLSQKESYPVLIHCTQGKDRTGLVVLMVLSLLGVSAEEISRDYLLSIPGLEGDLEERKEVIGRMGLPVEEFAGCSEEWVGEVLGELEGVYGGVERFLVEECGILRAEVECVREILG